MSADTIRAVCDVLLERVRQVEVEGWAPEHDDAHSSGQMAMAAAYYAVASRSSDPKRCPYEALLWPCGDDWRKVGEPRRNMVKAAALLVAEIERLDRAAARAASASGDVA